MQQDQNKYDDKNYAKQPGSGMAHAVAAAAEPAAGAAEQQDDQENDQDRPKGHGTLQQHRRPAKRSPRRL